MVRVSGTIAPMWACESAPRNVWRRKAIVANVASEFTQFLYMNKNMDHQKTAVEGVRSAFPYLLVRTTSICVLKKEVL